MFSMRSFRGANKSGRIRAGSSRISVLYDYLVVAGGGGAGDSNGLAGGGAGGLLTATSVALTTGTTYTVTIGSGGVGGRYSGGVQTSGSASELVGGSLNVYCYGGGYSGSEYSGPSAAASGGSGGGGQRGNANGIGVYPGSSYVSAARQGYDGGINAVNSGPCYGGGGGGGAGGVGGNGGNNYQASGGSGLYVSEFTLSGTNSSNTTSGTRGYYAGGGDGACYRSIDGGSNGGYGPQTSGTRGGGGKAGYKDLSNSSGQANTGGGGSGYGTRDGENGAAYPGNGGSGIVIVRYPEGGATLTTTGSPSVTTSGGYRYYTWTSSGSFTV